MATSPMPDPQQQPQGSAAASPDSGASSAPDGSSPDGSDQSSPSSAPANPLQMLLARWYQTAKQMAASDPRLASGAGKVADGIQEMQTALITPPQQPSPGQSAQ